MKRFMTNVTLITLAIGYGCSTAPKELKNPEIVDEPTEADCYTGIHLELTATQDVREVQYVRGDCYDDYKVVTRYSSAEAVYVADGEARPVRIEGERVIVGEEEIGALIFDNGHYSVELENGIGVELRIEKDGERRAWQPGDGVEENGDQIWVVL